MANGLRKLIKKAQKQMASTPASRRVNRFGSRLRVEELEERIAPAAVALAPGEFACWDVGANDDALAVTDGIFAVAAESSGFTEVNIALTDGGGPEAVLDVTITDDGAADDAVIIIGSNQAIGSVDLSGLNVATTGGITVIVQSGLDFTAGTGNTVVFTIDGTAYTTTGEDAGSTVGVDTYANGETFTGLADSGIGAVDFDGTNFTANDVRMKLITNGTGGITSVNAQDTDLTLTDFSGTDSTVSAAAPSLIDGGAVGTIRWDGAVSGDVNGITVDATTIAGLNLGAVTAGGDGDVAITAVTSIGATDFDSTASSGAGSVSVDAGTAGFTNTVDFGNVTASAAGDVTITTAGNYANTVTVGNVTASGAGNIEISATGNFANTLDVGNIGVSGAGDVLIETGTAGDFVGDVTLGNLATTGTGTGDITLTTGVNGSIGNVEVGSVSSGSTGTDSNIFIGIPTIGTVTGDMGNFTATGIISNEAGSKSSIIIGSPLGALGDVSLAGITLNSTDVGGDITIQGESIGTLNTSALIKNVDNATGDILISSAGAIGIVGGTAFTGIEVAGDGNVTIAAGTTIGNADYGTVDVTATGNGDVSITADTMGTLDTTSLTLAANSAGNIDIEAVDTIGVTNLGNLTLNSTGDITVDGGDTGFSGTLTMADIIVGSAGAGAVTVTTSTNGSIVGLTQVDAITNNSTVAGSVTIQAAGTGDMGGFTATDVISNDAAAVDGAIAIGSASGDLGDVSLAGINLQSTNAGGNVTIDGLTIGAVDSSAPITIAAGGAGSVSISSAGTMGALGLDDLTNNGTGDITVEAVTSIATGSTVVDLTAADSGNVTLDGGGTGFLGTLGTGPIAVSDAGNVKITTAGDFDGAVTLGTIDTSGTATGDIILETTGASGSISGLLTTGAITHASTGADSNISLGIGDGTGDMTGVTTGAIANAAGTLGKITIGNTDGALGALTVDGITQNSTTDAADIEIVGESIGAVDFSGGDIVTAAAAAGDILISAEGATDTGSIGAMTLSDVTSNETDATITIRANDDIGAITADTINGDGTIAIEADAQITDSGDTAGTGTVTSVTASVGVIGAAGEAVTIDGAVIGDITAVDGISAVITSAGAVGNVEADSDNNDTGSILGNISGTAIGTIDAGAIGAADTPVNITASAGNIGAITVAGDIGTLADGSAIQATGGGTGIGAVIVGGTLYTPLETVSTGNIGAITVTADIEADITSAGTIGAIGAVNIGSEQSVEITASGNIGAIGVTGAIGVDEADPTADKTVLIQATEGDITSVTAAGAGDILATLETVTSGDIGNIDAGTGDILGSITSAGSIGTIDADNIGDGAVDDFDVAITATSGGIGAITVGTNLGTTANPVTITSTAGNIGAIDVTGDADATVTTTNSGDLAGLAVGGDMTGNVDIADDVTGNIDITGSLTGTIAIDGDLTADITVGDGDITSVTVGGAVDDTGGDIAIEAEGSILSLNVTGNIGGNGNDVTIVADSDSDDGGNIGAVAGGGVVSGGAITADISGYNIYLVQSGGEVGDDISNAENDDAGIVAANDIVLVDAGAGSIDADVTAAAATSGSPLATFIHDGVSYAVWAFEPGSTSVVDAGVTADVTWTPGVTPTIAIADLADSTLGTTPDIYVTTRANTSAVQSFDDPDVAVASAAVNVTMAGAAGGVTVGDINVEGNYTLAPTATTDITISGDVDVEGSVGGTITAIDGQKLTYGYVSADLTINGNPALVQVTGANGVGIAAGQTLTINSTTGATDVIIGAPGSAGVADIADGGNLVVTGSGLGQLTVTGDVNGSITAPSIEGIYIAGDLGAAMTGNEVITVTGALGDVFVGGGIGNDAAQTLAITADSIGTITAIDNIGIDGNVSIVAETDLGGVISEAGELGDVTNGDTVVITAGNGSVSGDIGTVSAANDLKATINAYGSVGTVSTTEVGASVEADVTATTGDIDTVSTIEGDLSGNITANQGTITNVTILDDPDDAGFAVELGVNAAVIVAEDVENVSGDTITGSTTATLATASSPITIWTVDDVVYTFSATAGPSYSYSFAGGSIDITVDNWNEGTSAVIVPSVDVSLTTTAIDAEGASILDDAQFNLGVLDFGLATSDPDEGGAADANTFGTITVEGSITSVNAGVGGVIGALIAEGDIAGVTTSSVSLVAAGSIFGAIDAPTAAQLEMLFANPEGGAVTFAVPTDGDYVVPVSGASSGDDVTLSIGDGANLLTPINMSSEGAGEYTVSVAAGAMTVASSSNLFDGDVTINGDLDYVLTGVDLDDIDITGSIVAGGGIFAEDIGAVAVAGDMDGYIVSEGDITSVTVDGAVGIDGLIMAGGTCNVIMASEGSVAADIFVGSGAPVITGNAITGTLVLGAVDGVTNVTLRDRIDADDAAPVTYTINPDDVALVQIAAGGVSPTALTVAQVVMIGDNDTLDVTVANGAADLAVDQVVVLENAGAALTVNMVGDLGDVIAVDGSLAAQSSAALQTAFNALNATAYDVLDGVSDLDLELNDDTNIGLTLVANTNSLGDVVASGDLSVTADVAGAVGSLVSLNGELAGNIHSGISIGDLVASEDIDGNFTAEGSIGVGSTLITDLTALGITGVPSWFAGGVLSEAGDVTGEYEASTTMGLVTVMAGDLGTSGIAETYINVGGDFGGVMVPAGYDGVDGLYVGGSVDMLVFPGAFGAISGNVNDAVTMALSGEKVVSATQSFAEGNVMVSATGGVMAIVDNTDGDETSIDSITVLNGIADGSSLTVKGDVDSLVVKGDWAGDVTVAGSVVDDTDGQVDVIAVDGNIDGDTADLVADNFGDLRAASITDAGSRITDGGTLTKDNRVDTVELDGTTTQSLYLKANSSVSAEWNAVFGKVTDVTIAGRGRVDFVSLEGAQTEDAMDDVAKEGYTSDTAANIGEINVLHPKATLDDLVIGGDLDSLKTDKTVRDMHVSGDAGTITVGKSINNAFIGGSVTSLSVNKVGKHITIADDCDSFTAGKAKDIFIGGDVQDLYVHGSVKDFTVGGDVANANVYGKMRGEIALGDDINTTY